MRARPVAVDGASFSIHEWRDSGPAQLQVHHEDDEAWHVLEGTLTFRFSDHTEEAGPARPCSFRPASPTRTRRPGRPATWSS